MRNRARGRRLRPGIESLDVRCLLSGFTPAQVTAAYGLAPITLTSPSGKTVAGDGSGQTIAIVGAYHNQNLASDLRVFNEAFNLPDADLTVVNLAGDQTNPLWALESALDVEWAHALAPGASILMVEARSDTATDMLEAVDIARNTPGVVAVSMSWGFPETSGQRSYDSHFTTPAGHTGITFVSASGDHGPEGGAVYPASSPNVLGVGGTSLVLGETGAYQSETVWAKSGSGYSRYSAEPNYQRSLQRSGKKSTPDVAFLGDPTTGVSVYHTPVGATQGSWHDMAGTSLGTPAWAAIVAIVAQGRSLIGKPSLDGPSQTLPLLYGLSSANFRVAGGLGAGLGTPNGSVLINSLVSASSGAPTAVTSESTMLVANTPVTVQKSPRRQAPAFRRKVAVPPRIPRVPMRWDRLANQAKISVRAAALGR